MATCVYDNPNTMQRECWQDGHLIAAYSEELLSLPYDLLHRDFFFGANIGDWKSGQLVGDIRAMSDKNK